MKLYTEEQVKKAIILTRNEYPLRYVEDIVNDLAPIELPTKEEIEEFSKIFNLHLDRDVFTVGAHWVLNQIKQQDNA